MDILISIPEKEYQHIINEGFLERTHGKMCYKAIKNGTPIPDNATNGEWVDVNERLPEEREWYLAVFKEKDTDYQLIPRVAEYIGKGENEWRIIDEEGLGQEYRDILECIAWTPLPEPYKAESEVRDED